MIRSTKVKIKKEDLESEISSLKKSFFTNFITAFENATIEEKRQLIGTFVRHIELVPDIKEIRIEFYPDHIVQSIGAGDRNRTGTGILIPAGF